MCNIIQHTTSYDIHNTRAYIIQHTKYNFKRHHTTHSIMKQHLASSYKTIKQQNSTSIRLKLEKTTLKHNTNINLQHYSTKIIYNTYVTMKLTITQTVTYSNMNDETKTMKYTTQTMEYTTK